MLDKFMISCDGSLYDTSKKEWSKLAPLRADFPGTIGILKTQNN